jgi:hypothetical protein|tara:strand:- start:1341 stop:1535 length:195 start_codon:yes stop_codon:yes gene_type:complete
MKCKICDETIFGHGHNAQPVANGRCCDTCQDIYVLPTRIDLVLSESPAFQMLQTLMRDVGGQTK